MRPTPSVIVLLVLAAVPCALAAPSAAADSPDGGMVVRVTTTPDIEREFESRFIAQRLNALGLSPSDVQARLDGLSNEEVHQLARSLRSTATAFYALPLFVALVALVGIAAAASRWHGPGATRRSL
jgi:hypothetical protein